MYPARTNIALPSLPFACPLSVQELEFPTTDEGPIKSAPSKAICEKSFCVLCCFESSCENLENLMVIVIAILSPSH
jgi:hypothetical protein